jgi:hypothetical protein
MTNRASNGRTKNGGAASKPRVEQHVVKLARPEPPKGYYVRNGASFFSLFKPLERPAE